MTISSAPASMTDEWEVTFLPFPNKETVGACTVSRGGFTYSGSLNHDIPETVKEFWDEARRAEAEYLAGLPGIEAAQDAIKAAA